jgi:hypothetical protein
LLFLLFETLELFDKEKPKYWADSSEYSVDPGATIYKNGNIILKIEEHKSVRGERP